MQDQLLHPETDTRTSCERAQVSAEEMLTVLASRVRFLTLTQIAKTWYGDGAKPMERARHAVIRLANRGLVDTTNRMVHPEISLRAPLYVWPRSNGKAPHFGRLSWKATSRFGLPTVRTACVLATNKAHALFGDGRPRRALRTFEVAHDLQVAHIYLRLREKDPHRAASWVLEDNIEHEVRSPRPDAMISTPSPIVIEFLGSYAASKIARMFREYRERGDAFEFW